ncbi:MAG: PRC-barrel domain-containing protein [Methanobacteriota archaeon]|jgi:sporulation protein YlmC with PRC-barrel domain
MVVRLSEIGGLEVFTEGGKHVGIVEDFSIDPETGKVLGVVLSKVDDEFLRRMGVEGSGKGVVLPYEAVKSIGDIVIMKSITYGAQEEI